SLSDLAADVLTLVPHALALVRVGPAQLADVRGDLADLLLVDALDDQLGRLLHLQRDARGGLDGDRVAVAARPHEALALAHHAATAVLDLQRLLEALRRPGAHAVHQGPGEPVQTAHVGAVLGPAHDHLAVLEVGLDGRGDRVGQRALRPLDGDLTAVDADLDTAGHGDGIASDSRHWSEPSPHHT